MAKAQKVAPRYGVMSVPGQLEDGTDTGWYVADMWQPRGTPRASRWIGDGEPGRLAALREARRLNTPAPTWRDHLDTALDAMKIRRTEEAERMFDELDELYADAEPNGDGWQFEVPYRTQHNSVRTVRNETSLGYRTQSVTYHTFKCDRRVKHIIATMLFLVHAQHNRSRGRPFGERDLADAFGVRRETMRHWIECGLRDLGVGEPDGRSDAPRLEDDFDPPEVRREQRRKQAMRLFPFEDAVGRRVEKSRK